MQPYATTFSAGFSLLNFFKVQWRQASYLGFFSLSIALLFALPMMVIVGFLFSGNLDVWRHLASTVLDNYIGNSLLLMLGVSVGVLLLGVPTAWLTSIYSFPGQKILSWALLLPLAFPAYIIAYTYTGIFDVAGPVQSYIRELTGLRYGEYWFFNIRSIGGAVVMLSLVLYPYVYLLARSAFLEQSSNIIDACRLAGFSRSRSWMKIGLPMARPAIVAGLTLALMETLADYGTVQYFGVSTFTTGIFRTFYGFGETAAAAQLSAVLLSFVIVLIFLERYSRRRIRYYSTQKQQTPAIKLRGKRAVIAVCVCSFPLLLGFVLPAWQLSLWAFNEAVIHPDFMLLAWHSFYLAAIAAMVAVSLALVLAYAKRLHRGTFINSAVSFAGFGYALPGTIVAIGIIIPFAWLDHKLIDWFDRQFNVDVGLILSGTFVAMIFAYSVRFMAVSLGAVESGLGQVKPNLDRAARLSGCKPLTVLKTIHLPLLKGSILTALLITFVDVLKELPATLILRPFNFNTLAIQAYELASDERLVDAAPASLCIVAVGIIPVILLSRSITLNKRNQS